MDTRYVDDLCDRTDWIACSIELQSSNDDLVHAALGRIGELQERIDERSREDVVPFQTLTTRVSLSETEQQIVMLLVALRTRPDLATRFRQHAGAGDLSSRSRQGSLEVHR